MEKITVSNGMNATLYHFYLRKIPNQIDLLPDKTKQKIQDRDTEISNIWFVKLEIAPHL